MLTDLQIVLRLCARDDKRIVVTPLVDPRQLGAASIDLRLGFHFKTVQNGAVSVLDPLTKTDEALELDTERYTYEVKKTAGEPFFLHPGEFALGTSFEYVRIPLDIAAVLEGRSSLGRLGITIHSTAGFIDPGFRGRITFEMQNEGTQPVALYAGMRVAQLCFHQLDGEVMIGYGKSKGSKYRQQLTTTSSRWYKDVDVRFFRDKFPANRK